MNFELTEDQAQVMEWAKKLSEEVIAPKAEHHSREKISEDFLKRLSEEGVMTMMVPQDLGGLGLDTISYLLALREISKVCASTGVTVSVTNMIADVLLREASEELKKKYIQKLVSGKSLTASFCLTESNSGSDASALKTVAKPVADGFEITGEKIYVTNARFSQFYLVMARTSEAGGSKGLSAFLVDRDQSGVHLGKEEDKTGIIGSSTMTMSFDRVKVVASQMVATEGEGFKVAMRALDGGRISIAAQALGIASAALEAGLKYSKEREQFGKPIAEFQAIQWKLADAATKMAAAEALMFRAGYLKQTKSTFTRAASMAKLFSTEIANEVCNEMVQIHGGYGYIKEYPVERYFRDVRVSTLYEGTSEIQRLVIARDLLQKGLL